MTKQNAKANKKANKQSIEPTNNNDSDSSEDESSGQTKLKALKGISKEKTKVNHKIIPIPFSMYLIEISLKSF